MRFLTLECVRERGGGGGGQDAVSLPVLILHGSADKVTNPRGSQLFYDTAGTRDKTLKLYEGHAHDLLNDLDREVVLADIADWIDAHLSAEVIRDEVAAGVTHA